MADSELETRLLTVINEAQVVMVLHEALAPLLGRLAGSSEEGVTIPLASTILAARDAQPNAKFTSFAQLASALAAVPDVGQAAVHEALLNELRVEVTPVFVGGAKPRLREPQVLRDVNGARTDADLERALSPYLASLEPIAGTIEASELAKVVRETRSTLPDERFAALAQIIDVVATSFLDRFVARRLRNLLVDAPWTTHPTLLVPLRLETRFKNNKLLVRIYPDQICLDTHRSELSLAEYQAVRTYRDTPPDRRVDAWRMLSTRFGPSRAAWLVTWSDGRDLTTAPPDLRSSSWTRPPRLRLLPDRFCVYAYRGGNLVHRKLTRSVRKEATVMGAFDATVPLRLTGTPGTHIPADSFVTHNPTGVRWELKANAKIGPDGTALLHAKAARTAAKAQCTSDWSIHSPVVGWEAVESLDESSCPEGLFDEDSEWIHDFPAAVRDGFAVELDLAPNEAELGFDRVVAIGLRWSDPTAASVELEELLQAHRFSDGLGFVASGTPTNNTEEEPSGVSTKESHDRAYEIQVAGPSNWAAQNQGDRCTNAHRLAKALGLAPEAFRYLERAGDTGDSYAREINTLTWPATGGYYLEYLLPGMLDSIQLARASAHQARFVRGGGPLPALRIGRQPYGVLPVTRVLAADQTPGGWAPWSGDMLGTTDPGFDRDLHRITTRLYQRWLGVAQNRNLVPRVEPDDDDPDSTLLRVLSMQPQSVSFCARPFVDEGFTAWVLATLRNYAFGPGSPYGGSGLTPAQWMTKWSEAWSRVRCTVEELLQDLTRGDEPGEPPSLGEAPSLGETPSFQDKPLLRMLAWFDGDIDPVPFTRDKSDPLRHPAEHLRELLSTGETAADSLLLSVARHGLAGPLAGVVREALGTLTRPDLQDQVDLDRLFRESLDIASHRVDAWVTSFATKRLEGMRDQSRYPEGLHVGAYGLVENLRARPTRLSQGYLHAPSSGQAAAAAVLYNAFLTHEPQHTTGPAGQPRENPFRINLTSLRVRQGLCILHGIREGQPLGALLGYQFERSLREHSPHLAQYIDDLRNDFPIVAHKVTPPGGESGSGAQPTEPAEAVAARNVVDGAGLARAYRDYAANPSAPPLAKFLLGVPAADLPALSQAMDRLLDSLDAASDLLLTESVYQTVQGNYARAGAALAATTGDQMPSELEAVTTPVAGRRYTHRVCALFNSVSTYADLNARRADPRGAAEPRISAWFSELLGPLSEIGAGYEFWEVETAPPTPARVNVNTASVQQLCQLPKINKDLALVIQAERQRVPFRWLSDLERVRGIDAVTVAELRSRATTGYVERVNLNSVSAAELQTLPGVDVRLAEAIRRARPFAEIDDLVRVPGIDEAMLDSLRHRIIAPLIDLNRATLAQLRALPDLKAILADRILAAREQQTFDGVDDLMRVEGMDQRTLDRICRWLTTDLGVIAINELNLDDERCFSASDFLYAAQSLPGGGATELEQRIAQVVRRSFALPAEQRVEVHAVRRGGSKRSLADAVELAQQCFRLLSSGTALSPDKLCHPGDVQTEGYSTLDLEALRARVQDAQQGLRGLLDAFERATFRVPLRLSGPPGMRLPAGTHVHHKTTRTVAVLAQPLRVEMSHGSAPAQGDAIITASGTAVAIPPGADWVIDHPGPNPPRLESVASPVPDDPRAVGALLRRAGQYGIAGALPSSDDDPLFSTRFDNAHEELRRRYAASLALVPRLNVNTASIAALEGAVGQHLAQVIVRARAKTKRLSLEAVVHDTSLSDEDVSTAYAELASEDLSPTTDVKSLVSAMQELFGKSYVVLPTFVPQRAGDLATAFSQDALRGLGDARLRLWLQQSGEVRQPVAVVEDTLMFADAWTQDVRSNSPPRIGLELAQLPFNPGRAWIGLSDDERGPKSESPEWHRSPLSLVAVSSGALPPFANDTGDAATRVVTAGLLLDEWIELVPDRQVDTSVAFHYDAPSTQAPQCLLLAVPSQVQDVARLWTPEDLAAIVNDTLDLAKVRAVDIDALAGDSGAGASPAGPGPIGGIAPAMYLPVDPSRPGWEMQSAMGAIEQLGNDLDVAKYLEIPVSLDGCQVDHNIFSSSEFEVDAANAGPSVCSFLIYPFGAQVGASFVMGWVLRCGGPVVVSLPAPSTLVQLWLIADSSSPEEAPSYYKITAIDTAGGDLAPSLDVAVWQGTLPGSDNCLVHDCYLTIVTMTTVVPILMAKLEVLHPRNSAWLMKVIAYPAASES